MFSFQANYLRVLDLFAAKQDVRYYLNGYSVAPAPDGTKGCILRATDGHTAVFIRDYEGVCEGRHIIARNAEMVKHCKTPRPTKKDAGFKRWLTWEGDPHFGRIIIRSSNGNPIGDPADCVLGEEKWVSPLPTPLMDARFPYTDRLIPEDLEPGMGSSYAFNPDYIGRIKQARDMVSPYGKSGGVTPYHSPSRGIMTFTVHGAAEMLFLVMPMRDENQSFSRDQFLTGEVREDRI